MKKTLFVMLVCAALVGAFCLPSLWAVDAPKGVLELKVPDGATATKTSAKFNHEGVGHKANECKTCHHKEGQGMKCSGAGCHDNKDLTDKTSDRSFYMAFHKGDSSKSCLGCHKKAKADGKNAPIACPVCHPAQ